MKLLVTGAAGQLGGEFVAGLGGEAVEVTGVDTQDLDLRDAARTAGFIADQAADWVIHCGAYTRVDRAEADREQAFAVNVDGARAVAEGVRRCGGRMVYISTDFVFGGDKSSPYCEEDRPAPLSVYGESKWRGEQAVAEVLSDVLILRSGWLFGVNGANFVKTILRLAAEQSEIRVVDDQVGTPTWTADIVSAVWALVRKGQTGVVHFSNEGVASWYDFAREIVRLARSRGHALKVERVLPIPTSAYPTPARRPAYSVLSKCRVRTLLDYDIPHWRAGLAAMLEQLDAT